MHSVLQYAEVLASVTAEGVAQRMLQEDEERKEQAIRKDVCVRIQGVRLDGTGTSCSSFGRDCCCGTFVTSSHLNRRVLLSWHHALNIRTQQCYSCFFSGVGSWVLSGGALVSRWCHILNLIMLLKYAPYLRQILYHIVCGFQARVSNIFSLISLFIIIIKNIHFVLLTSQVTFLSKYVENIIM